MWRFFYCQAATEKKVFNDLRRHGQVLLFQPLGKRLAAQFRVLDLLDQNRDGFGRCGLPPHCFNRLRAV